jgi:hypothetical protein
VSRKSVRDKYEKRRRTDLNVGDSVEMLGNEREWKHSRLSLWGREKAISIQ